MSKKILFFSVITSICSPLSTYAAGTNIRDLTVGINSVMGRLVPLIIGFAMVVFLWGVLNYIFHANDVEKRKEGKNFMIWGLIGLFVMVSLWGIVAALANSLNFHLVIPSLPNLENR
ncbi:MAG: hypothetical protein WCO12_03535 [bacterium]